jgi:hypothetical protein
MECINNGEDNINTSGEGPFKTPALLSDIFFFH